tara:strand:- start:885 stop:4025 length:3141 start_codon:yes stop_codon:yes gene_type:complete
MANANFRVKNGLYVVENSSSSGNLTLLDGEIDSDQGLLLDAVGDITLDADGGEVFFAHAGVNHGQINNNGDDMVIRSLVSDGDMVFRGNDGGVNTAVLTLDMSEGGAATFNKGITLGGNITGPDNLDMAIAPQDGNYIDIDGVFKTSPAVAASHDATFTTSGGSSGSRTTLTATSGVFADFPQSGQVKIEGMTTSEQPYSYTRTSDTVLVSTAGAFDDATGVTRQITLVPPAIDINGQAAPIGNTGQFSHDGGQITLDGGKFGTANSLWATGANYGAVIINEANSFMKIKTSDNDSSYTYKDGTHLQVIPHVKIGSDTPNTIESGIDYFTGYFKTNANSGATVNERLFYNQVIHVDTLAMMKIKSSVTNAETQYNDALGSAMVIETASAGELNQLLFNFDNAVGAARYLNTGSGTLSASNYAYSVGGVYKSAGTSQGGTSASNFGMGYMNRSFNQAGTDLNSGPFTNGSSTYGAQGNPLATENTFFQANSTGQIGIGPAQTPSSFATLHVGATGATNVGGVIHFDDGSADPSTTTRSLYSKGGSLYWGTTDLSASSASALNDLSDVTFSSSTLTVSSLNAFVFANDADNSISVTATTGTTAGKPLTISAGSSATGSNNVNGGDLILASGGGDGTGTSSIQFKTKVSGTDAAAERMRIHTDGNVGIGDAAPGTLLQLSGENAYLTLKNTTDENTDGAAETKIIFEDHANASLGQIEVSHSGTANDTKGKMILSTHNGSSLTAALTINDSQLATFAGDVTISGNDLNFGNGATVVNTDADTLTITEATTVFSGDIRVNGNEVKDSGGNSAITFDGSGGVTILGDLTVSGDTVQQDVATVTVEDPLMQLARSNSADSLDIGFYAKYVASGTKYTGLFRDASDGDTYKLFATTGGSNAEPTTTVNTTSGFTLADLDVATLDATTLSINTSGTQDAIITSGSQAIAAITDGNSGTIDSFAVSSYPATKYLILVEDEDSNEFMSTEILALGHSTDFAQLTQYALLYSDTELGTFSVANSSGTISLTYAANSAGTDSSGHKVRVVATRIATIT